MEGPCSTQFHPALSCNLIGIPAPIRPKKVSKPKVSLMAPTSMLTIMASAGKPVLVGGPPTIDLFQLSMQLGLKGMGKLWKKTGDIVKKVPDNLPTMGFSKARCSKILGVKITPPKAKNTDNIVPLPKPSKVDDVSKKIDNPQKQIIDDVNSGKIPLEGYEGHKVGNHTRKSNYGEMNTDLEMESITEINGNPASLTALHEKITDIDTPIKQGIDHIYQNATPPPKYVIAESKYGSSTLNPNTKDGPQMSDDWIRGNNRLDEIVGKEKALEIKEALDNGDVDRVLSKIDVNGNVTTQKINSAGKIIGVWK